MATYRKFPHIALRFILDQHFPIIIEIYYTWHQFIYLRALLAIIEIIFEIVHGRPCFDATSTACNP